MLMKCQLNQQKMKDKINMELQINWNRCQPSLMQRNSQFSLNRVLIKLKQYIYLSPVRLINLASSILDNVHDEKLELGFKKYCLFAALYFQNIKDFQRLDDKVVHSQNTFFKPSKIGIIMRN
ncbi:unnamed protein product [Paramecium sonneborni]|uniref:Uncharacterized protein n=1 Tax=Paramecium sonneborni TaxID=65129 RepID=A0A8S1P6Q4_9CILI|nr:unnamed protein product [Paramecium sonneborni]